jgi:hypothetical protein
MVNNSTKISTKPKIPSLLNTLNIKKRPQTMMLENQLLGWDRQTIVVGLKTSI